MEFGVAGKATALQQWYYPGKTEGKGLNGMGIGPNGEDFAAKRMVAAQNVLMRVWMPKPIYKPPGVDFNAFSGSNER